MAKKSKKQVRKSAAARSSLAEVSKTAPASGTGYRDFNPDYSPVIKDLKRIGSLAGVFFVILVALSFLLR
jgi:hypothetical protein